jgi:dethiobiotin synthetase
MNSRTKLVIVGIGTDVGKTVVSAILAEYTKAVYWKPVQAGDLENSDSIKIRKYCSDNVTVYTEKFKLNTPASPHFAAKLDGIFIEEKDLEIPADERNWIIESAGGLMVPLNDEGLLYIDVIQSWKVPVVLVSRNYLGSINHTLLSLELLKQKQIPVQALIFVGERNESTENIILQRFPISEVTHIPLVEKVDQKFIREEALKLKLDLF